MYRLHTALVRGIINHLRCQQKSVVWLRNPLRASQAKMTAIAVSGFKTDDYLFKFYDFLEKRLDLHSLSRAELN